MTDTHPGGRASMIFLTTVVLPDPVPPAIPIIYMLRVFVDRLSLPVRRVSPCHGAASVLYQCKVSGFSPHAVWPQGGNSCVHRCGQLIYIKKSAENGEKCLQGCCSILQTAYICIQKTRAEVSDRKRRALSGFWNVRYNSVVSFSLRKRLFRVFTR